ncbi:hypothetical protein EGW08_000060 [Elysia chlorotica]|uniref:Carboxylesterase type B domain-containing protein n=1 Tax=Elysia chlorotica TaxID=188477 RepID=A0A433UEC0_ELYCH|nr:hypothetical protein EGW08_000060 [Elysia chlorotica]
MRLKLTIPATAAHRAEARMRRSIPELLVAATVLVLASGVHTQELSASAKVTSQSSVLTKETSQGPLLHTVASQGPGLTRMTSEGPVRGYLHPLANGQGVSERYLGVPFASPPVGSGRFQRPSPPPARNWTLSATSPPPACMQSNHDTSYISDYMPHYDGNMSEDCLYLNIYLPHSPQAEGQDSNPRQLLPVLVHIHGGSNEVGSSFMFQPDSLAVRGQLIVVTVGYRLGALGFLRVPKIGIHGNMGLWDQAMALSWLQENIESFAGDPAKVTLQGHSAGALDVGLHAMSPVSKGLFDDMKFLSKLYNTLKNYEDLATCSPVFDDIVTFFHFCCMSKHGDGHYTWSATIDGHFVPAAPVSLVSSKSHKSVLNAEKRERVALFYSTPPLPPPPLLQPLAEAVVKNKLHLEKFGRFPTAQEVTSDRSHVTEPPLLEEKDFHFAVDAYGSIPGIQELSSHTYFPWADPDNSTAVIMAMSDYAGDMTFTAPAVDLLDRISSLGITESYMYVFQHRSKLSRFPAWMGSIHGEDLAYVFGCPLDGQCGRNFTQLDQALSVRVIDMWANFVHSGYAQDPYLCSNSETTFQMLA